MSRSSWWGSKSSHLPAVRMDIEQQFASWRAVNRAGSSWGLAWYLANQFARRYYASHGIAPYVNEHEGLGYYGIMLEQIPCPISGKVSRSLGRMTICGDVENWQGGRQDRWRSSDLCDEGLPTAELVLGAIRRMSLPTRPSSSHVQCRHKRWGSSWLLCFDVATYLALRYEVGELQIWNHPYHVDRLLQERDELSSMPQHPGAFLFRHHDRSLLIAGDGRFLDGSCRNLWDLYMDGACISTLAGLVGEGVFAAAESSL
jgi:hypothetical protein